MHAIAVVWTRKVAQMGRSPFKKIVCPVFKLSSAHKNVIKYELQMQEKKKENLDMFFLRLKSSEKTN